MKLLNYGLTGLTTLMLLTVVQVKLCHPLHALYGALVLLSSRLKSCRVKATGRAQSKWDSALQELLRHEETYAQQFPVLPLWQGCPEEDSNSYSWLHLTNFSISQQIWQAFFVCVFFFLCVCGFVF